jgi:inner membrane protein
MDVIGFSFGVRYGDFWGHRGFTHSLFFAAMLAVLVAGVGLSRGSPGLNSLWLCFSSRWQSHDAGCHDRRQAWSSVPFPFENTRYFFRGADLVSPISLTRFFAITRSCSAAK